MFRSALLAAICCAMVACARPGPPAVDSIPPQLTLTALNGMTNPVFISGESGGSGDDHCALYSSFPARFTLAVRDLGGVRSAEVNVVVLSGRIVRSSVSVSPSSSRETDYQVTEPDGRTLTIDVYPPRPGWVHTRLVATFSVIPSDLDVVSIRAWATDVAGNRTDLYQVDARKTGSGFICRK